MEFFNKQRYIKLYNLNLLLIVNDYSLSVIGVSKTRPVKNKKPVTESIATTKAITKTIAKTVSKSTAKTTTKSKKSKKTKEN